MIRQGSDSHSIITVLNITISIIFAAHFAIGGAGSSDEPSEVAVVSTKRNQSTVE